MKNRIIETRLVKWMELQDLQPENIKLPYNHKHLKESILKHGFSMPFFGWENEGQILIIDGHSRKQILTELISEGLKVPESLPVCLIDAKDRKDAVTILLEVFNERQNPIAEEILTEWIELEEVEVNIDALNIALIDVDVPEVLDAKEDDYEIPDQIETDIVLGDLFEIGQHRLLCGDSTQTDTFAKLFGEQLADLVVTDPPYNVAYEGKTKKKLTIDNDNMGDDEFYKFLYDFYTALGSYTKAGGSWYVWHADSEGANFRRAMANAGIMVKQCLIWIKNSMVMGRQDYQWKHEPCLYGWKEGAAHGWYSDRKQTTVLNFDRPQRNTEHPTMKPIPLFAYQIGNSSKQGDIVADGFGGSGTTMVACHQINRKAYLVEFDPKYCQVIVARMRKLDPTIEIKRNGVKYEC